MFNIQTHPFDMLSLGELIIPMCSPSHSLLVIDLYPFVQSASIVRHSGPFMTCGVHYATHLAVKGSIGTFLSP